MKTNKSLKSIVCYTEKMPLPKVTGYSIEGRDPRYWKGLIERRFDYVMSSDKRIIDAYGSRGIPEYKESNPKRRKKT